MSFDALDPNRFATGAEAQSMQARIDIEQAEVDLATRRYALAEETQRDAEQRFIEAEAAYKLQLAARDDALAYLERSRSQLAASAEQLAHTKAPLHPVRKTPLEVLGLIFQACLTQIPLRGPLSEAVDHVRERQRQPFHLAAVCRRWRRASLYCPQAWSVLDLRLDDITRSNGRIWTAYISTILTRSSSAMLSIRVMRDTADNGSTDGHITLLLSAMHRCFSLLVSAREIIDETDTLVPLLISCAPVLEILHLMVSMDTDVLEELEFFPYTLGLRHLRTSFPMLARAASFSSVGNGALCTPSAADNVESFLVACENVSTFSVINPNFTGDRAAVEQFISDSVHVLKVTKRSIAGDLGVLSHLFVFPKLYMLKLCGKAVTGQSRVEFLRDVGSNSPALRTVIIDFLAPDSFNALLDALPTLSQLRVLIIHNSHIDAPGVAQLCTDLGRKPDAESGDGSETWLCPRLMILNLRHCTVSGDCAQEKFVELVQRRLRAAAGSAEDARRPERLSTFMLPSNCNPEIASQVARLIADK